MTALWLLPVAAFVAFSWWAARDLSRWVDFSREARCGCEEILDHAESASVSVSSTHQKETK